MSVDEFVRRFEMLFHERNERTLSEDAYKAMRESLMDDLVA